jgi:hypothetical protein
MYNLCTDFETQFHPGSLVKLNLKKSEKLFISRRICLQLFCLELLNLVKDMAKKERGSFSKPNAYIWGKNQFLNFEAPIGKLGI